MNSAHNAASRIIASSIIFSVVLVAKSEDMADFMNGCHNNRRQRSGGINDSGHALSLSVSDCTSIGVTDYHRLEVLRMDESDDCVVFLGETVVKLSSEKIF